MSLLDLPPVSFPGFGSGDLARRRAAAIRTRTIFGVPVGQAATTFLSGLATPATQTGFFGGLQAGLRGSLGASAAFQAQQTHQQEIDAERARQASLDALAQRFKEAQAAREQAALNETIRHNQATEGAKTSAQPSELGLFLTNPDLYKRYKNAGRAPEQGTVALTPEALDQAAGIYAFTGHLPYLGMGSAGGGRQQVMNRAATLYPSANIAATESRYKADTKALSTLQTSHDQLMAFENTALKNATVLEGLVDKIPQTGSTWANFAARKAALVTGDPNMSAFNTALEVVTPEFAKILQSGGTISGQRLSDAAKKDMQHVLNGDFTKAQLLRSLGVLKRDAANRERAYQQQVDTIQARLSTNPVSRAKTLLSQQQGPQDIIYTMDAGGNLVPQGQ